MTSFDEDAWIAKARKRKAYRDHCRDKFFTACGVSKGAGPSDVTETPFQKRRAVVALMKVARKGIDDPDHRRMFSLLAIQMMRTGIGKGAMGHFSGNILDLEEHCNEGLRSFFTTSMFYDGKR